MSGKKSDRLISKNVMTELKKGQIKMHSNHFFAFITAVTTLALVISIVASVYCIDYVIAYIKNRMLLKYLGFGSLGFGRMLLSFPWLWVIAALLAGATTWWLLRRYDFSYRSNHYGYLVAVLAGLILLAGGLAWRDIDLPGNPSVPSFITDRHSHHLLGQLTGIVAAANTNNLTLMLSNGQSVEVETSTDTLGLSPDGLSAGDQVEILGEWHDDTFRAKAIRPTVLPSQDRFDPNIAPLNL